MFADIVNNNFKNIFNSAISSLLDIDSLAVPCTIKYVNPKGSFCTNCVFDSLMNRSSNIYNDTGPIYFVNSICPVCNGKGLLFNDITENVVLAVIFDSKYFINWDSKNINVPAGTAQTLCSINLMSKIRNANSVVFNSNLSVYAQNEYIRMGEPTPCGLGDHVFITTLWQKK